MQQTLEGFRLSPQQARLWLLQQRSNAYRASCSLVIEGHLHVPTLRQVLEAVFMRHEMCRTSFLRLPGVKLPVQVVHTSPLYNWTHRDIGNCSPEEQQKLLKDFVLEATAFSFDLERGSFAHCTLFTIHEKKHTLFAHLHALYADTATLCHFVKEIADGYKHSVFSTVPDSEGVQYLQFAEWQNALLEEEDEAIGKAYWRGQGIEALSSLTLPFERKVSEQTSFSPTLLAASIDAGISAQMQAMLEKLQCSFPVFSLACWQILLWRLTGRDDILIGLGINGRNIEELIDTAGLLAKDMPLLCNLAKNPPFAELLTRINETYKELLSLYPYFSWEDVGSSPSIATALPLYPFSFDFREQPPAYEVEELSFSLDQCFAYYEPFKVKVVAVLSVSTLTIEFHYDTNLFDKRDIQRVASQFMTLVEHAVKEPETRISELGILSATELKQLLVDFNLTQTDYSRDRCLHHLFEQQVARTPDAVVAYDGERHLTYLGLDRWANRVAHYLQGLGVQPEGLIGLYLERSVEVLVGILGILKAGGAYVPLDPASPKKRLTSIVSDAHLSVIVTDSNLIKFLPEIQKMICLDTDWTVLSQYCGEKAPACRVIPLNLAYVIYTSGSTGQPKGVMISHDGLVHYINWCCQRYQVVAGTGIPLHSSLAFDLTVTSLFASLVVGGSVWLIPEDTGIEEFANTLRRQLGFSLVKLTPAHLDLLNQSLAPAELAGTTRMLIVGGEALRAESLTAWHLHAPETRLINEYGPTETVVGCSVYEVPRDGLMIGNVPIGRPIANTQIYLLDRQWQPVPLGVTGEVFIGGIGLSRGYLDRTDLTAERFVPHPFSSEAGARLYRTGDLARYVSCEGDLEYVGRIDQQVKVRGYRVELGEIEGVLSGHPAVRECLVFMREEKVGNQQLVAYVVGEQPEMMPSMSELREYLREHLPSYMIPDFFVMVAAFPLTANGKVDRRALPSLESQQEEKKSVKAVPRTAIQELLAELWGEVLGRSKVNISDDFFELGGHSLLAMRLMARVQAVLGVEMPVRAVFDAPTVVGLAQQVEQTLRKGEELAMPLLVPLERPEEIPLSFAQQRLWFLDQLEPGSTVYLTPQAQRFFGDLNAKALEQSLQELVHRHEILRTIFLERAGQPMQVICPAGHSTVPVIDLQGLEPEQREQEAHSLANQERQRPCDLAKGPLLRTYMMQLERQEHVLLLTLHHSITDGWSNEVLVHELITLYQAFVVGQPSPLAPLPIQYADYALWQREWLQGEVLQGQLAYWRKQLADLSPLTLPTDHPHPAVQTYQGAIQSLQLSAPMSEKLMALSRQEDVTLFMLLLAMFQVLLMRYTGQMDISVGTPIANRRQAELEEMIGFFVNTLVLRTDLSGNPTLHQMLGRVREVCLGAYAHQDIPFEKVVEELEPERDLSRSPLFQVLFVLQNVPNEQAELPGVSVKPLVMESMISKFDLTLSIGETRQGLHCSLEYNTDLFEAETITRMLGHWQTLLEGVVQTPQARLFDLPVLTESEREQLLVKWNATQRDSPQDLCVHHLFEQQVQRTPDVVALGFEEETLTYAELNRRANQLAHYLRDLGVGPEVLVGICMERSLELVVGLLAVLKAGGAYVPLDPTYPAERLAFMVWNTRISVLLKLHDRQDPLSLTSTTVANLKQIWNVLEQLPEYVPESRVQAKNIAYVIHTSGSTGVPKGIACTHYNVLNNLTEFQRRWALPDDLHWSLWTNISFDVSVYEIFLPLLSRGTLYLIPEGIRADALACFTWLKQCQVQGGYLPPFLLGPLQHWLCQQASAIPVLALRYLLVGVEPIPEGQLLALMRSLPALHILNGYGPTETTICATLYSVGVPIGTPRATPIGQPMQNVEVYVLDTALQPVPQGVIGELYIGGEGVARGYVGQPELTAKCFVPHPFCQQLGARLYRTGDLVRYLPDGNIEFVGRLDQQVKIRGYRIELGEIEVVLREHPAIQESVVLARDDLPGGKRLVAYLVPYQEHTLTISDLRVYLHDRLPTYMLPSAWMVLNALPLTPTGKVDRRALPAPDAMQTQEGQTLLAPRTAVEQELAAIWAQVLPTKSVGIRDNFFELGGDSILSIQMIVCAKQRGLHLTVKQLFQYQTIEQLSSVVDVGTLVQAEQGLVIGSVPLTPIQHWFFDLHLATPQHWNQALFLEIREHLKSSFLEDMLGAWLKHHDALRLRFSPSDGGWHQWLSAPEGTHPFCMIDLSRLDELKQGIAATNLAAQAQTSLDIVHGPILRVVLFDKGADRAQLLLMVIHHLAVDGVSWRILLEDLQTAYQQVAHGQAIELPAKTSSFKVWAEHLVEYAQSSTIQQEQSYWLASSDKQVHSLPVDFLLNEQVNTVASARTVTISLTAEETRTLLEDVPPVYHTQINEVLLTALAQALAEWTESSCVLVDLEGHGREDLFIDVDVSRTVGWFTSVFPVKLDLGGTDTVAEALKAVKEQLRTIPNHGIGYSILRYLFENPVLYERLHMHPQAEVVFNYLGQFDQVTSSTLVAGSSHLSVGPTHSLQGRRTHLLEINCHISASQFRMAWTYSEHIHLQSTIEHLATAFTHALRSIIQHCQSPEAGGYTPSDFPNVELSQEELEQIIIEMDH